MACVVGRSGKMKTHDLPSNILHLLLSGQSGRELTFLLAVAFIAGLARGFSGFGAALIFMPLASSVIGPQVAAPLLLIIDAVAALGLIPDAWQRSDRRNAGVMAVGALIGVPLGTAALSLADPLTVRWGIVVAVVALLVLLASGWRYHGRPSAILTIGVGAISGLFTGAAQIGGPPVVAYWLGGSIASATVRANIVLYFAISTALTGASYVVGGLITQPVLVLSLTTGPLYGLGLHFGSRLFSRAKERTFRLVCYGLITAAAIIGLPVFDGIMH
jgi:uncharacterized membrane protein YfcA